MSNVYISRSSMVRMPIINLGNSSGCCTQLHLGSDVCELMCDAGFCVCWKSYEVMPSIPSALRLHHVSQMLLRLRSCMQEPSTPSRWSGTYDMILLIMLFYALHRSLRWYFAYPLMYDFVVFVLQHAVDNGAKITSYSLEYDQVMCCNLWL